MSFFYIIFTCQYSPLAHFKIHILMLKENPVLQPTLCWHDCSRLSELFLFYHFYTSTNPEALYHSFDPLLSVNLKELNRCRCRRRLKSNLRGPTVYQYSNSKITLFYETRIKQITHTKSIFVLFLHHPMKI